MTNLQLDWLYIGSSPYEEDCAQTVDPDYYTKSRKELHAFKEMIQRVHTIPDTCKNVSFGIKEGEVVVYYNPDIKEEVEYALLVESSKQLSRWDAKALKELKDSKEELKKGEFVKVIKLPKCDFCDKVAAYDGKTKSGPWANMCSHHWTEHGIGQLGTGRGQKLLLKEQEAV